MANRFHILMDDGAFIEVGRHVVRRGADQLHAARVGLMIGLGALETRQERMVDVDAAARQLGREAVGQDLHVTRQNDKLRAGVADELP